ncbi:ATPase AAA [Paenibacillus sp. CCS19]|uniref:ATP-binding protein n=1 Tax=Paenibacillus sp. CCS19 TaxID=3158387 RepID=UPI0025634D7C|nr:ATP-binding protein [Paenibacillus cellulosilyticus]GMK40228.1 ATPase AAA [Paenibacillus cellulosilyticus]
MTPTNQLIIPYKDHLDHLQAEFARLDALIRIEMERMAIREEAQDELTRNYPGLALTREEMLRLLDEGGGREQSQASQARSRLSQWEEPLRALEEELEQRCKASEELGMLLPLRRIAVSFRLTPYERDCLLVAIALQVDIKYGKLFGFLQDDATNQRPTVSLTMRLAGDDDGDPRRLLRSWLPGGALREHRLVTLGNRPIDEHASVLAAAIIKPDEGITQYVLQPELLDARLRQSVSLLEAGESALMRSVGSTSFDGGEVDNAAQGLAAVLIGRKQQWAERRHSLDSIRTGQRTDKSVSSSLPFEAKANERVDAVDDSGSITFLLHGPAGSGRAELAAEACARAGVTMLLADVSRMAEDSAGLASTLQLLCREAALRHAVIGLQHADLLNAREEPGVFWRIVHGYQASAAGTVLLMSEEHLVPAPSASYNIPIVEISFQLPSVRERAALWQLYARQWRGTLDQSVNWLAIAEQYKLTEGSIREAWKLANALAEWRTARTASSNEAAADRPLVLEPTLTADDIREACRRQKQHRLGDIATRIVPQCRVEQLVLPPDQLRRIRQIISQLHNRHQVLTEWNFHGKLSRGKGTNVLFAGPPGTGKTMAAEAIAGELGLDLYRIDLSQIISKYIGETEKNLRRLFSEAEHSNAVLLFDEADALFGKRSEVKDSHDRHANTEIAYLLQKMEEYEGMSILATNLQHNMDEAFARRMAFRIEFQIPDEEHRYRLWQSMFPPESPRAADIDFPYLARHLRLSGGSIKNAVLTAAYLAAGEGTAIGMRHMIAAVKQEFDKLGKLCLREDFGPYYDWIT